jgi:hypothetical protein
MCDDSPLLDFGRGRIDNWLYWPWLRLLGSDLKSG